MARKQKIKKRGKNKAKSLSKYVLLYGRSIKDMVKITGYSSSTIHTYLQDASKRKILFAEMKRILEERRKKKKLH